MHRPKELPAVYVLARNRSDLWLAPVTFDRHSMPHTSYSRATWTVVLQVPAAEQDDKENAAPVGPRAKAAQPAQRKKGLAISQRSVLSELNTLQNGKESSSASTASTKTQATKQAVSSLDPLVYASPGQRSVPITERERALPCSL